MPPICENTGRTLNDLLPIIVNNGGMYKRKRTSFLVKKTTTIIKSQ